MKSRAGNRTARTGVFSLFVLVAALAGMPVAGATAAPPYPQAVLLVSGFQTESPFSTPAIDCEGQEGDEWNPPGFPAGSSPEGIAPVLKDAGFKVFTAPVTKSSTPLPPTCVGTGEPVPVLDLTAPDTMVIQSNGDTDSNGAALARLIGFLKDSYGVDDLRVVGHSDGGLWSRSAITQNAAYAGLDIPSLTTLGTPHTGSYLADLAMELKGGKCRFSNPTEQRICEALKVVADLVVFKLGLAATKELSNDFLATWNPQQSIGSCPVSAIAGNHFNFGIPFLSYYTPSDGLVGRASAQARRAIDISGYPIPAPAIPDLREAGVYDVVHGGSLTRLYGKTLLNQAQISAQVANTLLLEGSSDCNIAAAPPSATASSAAPSSAEASSVEQRLRAPLYRMVPADTSGILGRPGDEDFAVTRKGVGVRCGLKALPAIPMLGDERLRIHHVAGCNKMLRAVVGNDRGAARALLLRSNRSRHAIVRVRGNGVQIRIRGRQPSRLAVHYASGSRWKKLNLGGRGWAALPDTAASSLRLRIRTRDRGTGSPVDTANLNLAR